MSQKRYHASDKVVNHPMTQTAFRTIAALLMATNAKDLECDFAMYDKDGNGKQYHFEVTEVADMKP
jgi:hypothetical protein